MPDHPKDLPDAIPQAPIVAPAARAFWSEAIKAVISFIAAQALIAVGLPVDDWARAAFAAMGGEIDSGQAWWIAASLLALGLYLMSRSLWRPARKTPA